MEGTIINKEGIASIHSSWMASNQHFKLASKERLDALQSHWVQATACFSATSDMIEFWWNRIQELHNQLDRAYHTLVHLEELLGFLGILHIDSANPNYSVLVLSIFFHDAIYDPKSATNEEDSAKLFESFRTEVGSCSQEHLQSRVVEFILATKHHNATHDPILGIFLDMDMAVLGKDASAYKAYAGLIRQEYIHVDRAVYCEKRAEILEAFLGEHSIFCCPLLKSALEERARENLRTEIDMLKRGIIPSESHL
jgi:predicted metal-dependent HD superfamily phosphohydrolase